MKNNITIYDVAREAGVSLATVSRVINGSAVVKEKTKNKVLKVIKDLDYQPNEIARGLAKNKTTTIGVVFPQSMFANLKNLIGGIGDIAQTLDYSINIYTTFDMGDNDIVKDITERVVKSRVDGVILFNNDYVDEMIQSLNKYDLPIVVIGKQYSSNNGGSISIDSAKVAYDLVKGYLDQGVKNITYVTPRQNFINSQELIHGIEKAYTEVGSVFPKENVITSASHYEANYPMFTEYFKMNKPELVICGYDKDAVAVLNGALDNGIEVPKDLEIVGILNSSYSIMCKPTISTLSVPVYDMGAMAVRLLTKLLDEDEIESKEVSVPYQYIKRNSTKG